MQEVNDEVSRLIDALKNSRTYLEFEKQKEILKADPELKAKVDAYRTENFKLQNSNDGNIEERLEAFAEKYADFIEEPKVSAFLDAEVNFCRMMQEVVDRVMNNLDFE